MQRLLAGALAAGLALSAAADGLSARSTDARWRVVAQAPGIAVYDADSRVKTLDAPSPAIAIRYLPARRSFVVAFETTAELWELSVDPDAAPIFEGLVHDHRLGEGLAAAGFLGARRTRLDAPLGELGVDDSGAYVLGRSAGGVEGAAALQLVQLDVRRVIGRFRIDGDPDLGAARSLVHEGRTWLCVPGRRSGGLLAFELQRARLESASSRHNPCL